MRKGEVDRLTEAMLIAMHQFKDAEGLRYPLRIPTKGGDRTVSSADSDINALKAMEPIGDPRQLARGIQRALKDCFGLRLKLEKAPLSGRARALKMAAVQ